MLPKATSFEALTREFRWQIPARYNIGVDISDKWAATAPDRTAIIHVHPDGRSEKFSFGWLSETSNRLANALQAKGIARGDRVIVYMPQAPEVATCHAAIYKLGAIALPVAIVFGPEALAYRLQNSGAKAVLTNAQGAAKVKEIRGEAPEKRKARALQLMDLLRLPQSYYAKSVMKCSGGERQRVALARALAYDPQILFFDEPLSAIDYKLRKTLEKELKDIHRETKKTFVYITHSLEEAMVMSDRIGVMRAGKLVQVGTPSEIYSTPNTRFVSEFVGDVNVISVALGKDGLLHAVQTGIPLKPPRIPAGFSNGHLVIRPEFLRFLSKAAEADNSVSGRLYNEYALGSRIQYQVRVGESVFVVEKLRQQAFSGKLDDDVIIGWDAADAILVTD